MGLRIVWLLRNGFEKMVAGLSKVAMGICGQAVSVLLFGWLRLLGRISNKLHQLRT